MVRRKNSRTRNRVGRTISKTTAVFQAKSLKRRVRTKPLRRSKNIAAPPDGLNQGLLAGALQLAAQPVDVHLEHVGRAFPVGLPEMFAHHLARDDLAGVAHEHFEEAEFGGCEID